MHSFARIPRYSLSTPGLRCLSSSSGLVEVSLDEVRQTATRAIRSHGYSAEEAPAILDVLLYAQMRGNNQGLVKLVGPPAFTKNPNATQIKVVKETNLSARIDGGQNSGFVVQTQAMETSIKKAKENMFGLTCTFNTSGSNGALGYYGQKIASQNLIGFLFAQSPEYVAPHGASQPIFGTNPLCIAVPGKDGHGVVLDMATSAIALYGVIEAKTAGKQLARGVAIDLAGQETTDPEKALAGAIRTFAGYKGSHLALMVEFLAGALSGGAVENKRAAANWGNTILCLDPQLIDDLPEFTERVDTVAKRLKSLKRLPGVDEILLPGERGDRTAAATAKRGALFLEPQLWDGVKAQAQKWSQ